MLFKNPQKKLDEQNKDETFLLQEVTNDEPKKINKKSIEEYIDSYEPSKFTD